MPKKPIRMSFPPADDTLPKRRGARPAGEVLKSPETNKTNPKLKNEHFQKDS